MKQWASAVEADKNARIARSQMLTQQYNRRSVQTRIREERAYNVGVAKMLVDRGFYNLAYSHLLCADELADVGLAMGQGKSKVKN